jgi:pimeloyl-ACP methyl ester carboxylesterase
VSYEERGTGAPIVMLHAALHDHADFDVIVSPLSQRYRTIALDWPGHGASDPIPGGLTGGGSLYADVLTDVVRELALPPAVFIGNSVGGYAAAKLAIDHPEQVAGLVLVNSGGFIRHTPLSRAFCRLLAVPTINQRLMPRLVPRYMKPVNDHDRAVTDRVAARARTTDGARLDASIWRSFTDVGYDLRSQAERITAPVLLIWGARDIILPAKAGRDSHAALPLSRLETLDTGHVVFASDADGFLAITEPFLVQATARPHR